MKPASPSTHIPYPLVRRRFLALVAGGLLAWPLVAEAQPAGNVWRIRLVSVAYLRDEDIFFQRLRELGYVEGQTLVVERRYSEGRVERFPEFAAELVRLKTDNIIIVTTTPAALAIKSATKTVSVVFPTAIDPVGTGVVPSLARPAGNITGSTTQAPEIVAKRLQLLKEALPHLSRVAVLWNAANPANASQWREVQGAARALGLTLQSREVRGPRDFERVFATMARERPEFSRRQERFK
jgi:putative ABC transport system substrate-binding protein